ncbi:hypothetical protein R5R35_002414 [Gryllus longicercus]|uniref:Citramalyl-CoA lyase, mitochondrial n=1 Tax=Gryllus longicercus TaxID=2509291 RepID=A0AAN9WGD2_9ORTH
MNICGQGSRFTSARRTFSLLPLVRYYTPRRAVLYAPGDDSKKLHKALSLNVDCVAMDCEDGVAVNRKDAARTTITKLLAKGPVSTQTPEWSVRINSVDSGLCADDISSIFSGSVVPPTVLLPKVDVSEHLVWFANKLSTHLKGKNSDKKINLIIYIESAKAILNLPAICRTAKELSASKPVEPVALVFGSDDLCASIGVTRSEDATEVMYARQKLVLVAKAFHLQAIDMVHINFKDLESLKKQCQLGASLGYTGKQIIHPSQVQIVQELFLPSEKQVIWAQGLVAAFQEHQAAGKGAFVYQGHMIDMPLLRQAQNILQMSAAAKSSGHDSTKY